MGLFNMIELTNSKDERDLAGKLRNLVNELIKDRTISYLRCVYTESNIDKKAYAKVLEEYFDVEPPRFLAIPDIILVFEARTRDPLKSKRSLKQK